MVAMMKIPYVPFSQLRATDTGTRWRDARIIEQIKVKSQRKDALREAARRVKEKP